MSLEIRFRQRFASYGRAINGINTVRSQDRGGGGVTVVATTTIVVAVGPGGTQTVAIATGGANDGDDIPPDDNDNIPSDDDDNIPSDYDDNMSSFAHGVPAQVRLATGVIHDLGSCVPRIICPTDRTAS